MIVPEKIAFKIGDKYIFRLKGMCRKIVVAMGLQAKAIIKDAFYRSFIFFRTISEAYFPLYIDVPIPP
jgi:hypothetical protein